MYGRPEMPMQISSLVYESLFDLFWITEYKTNVLYCDQIWCQSAFKLPETQHKTVFGLLKWKLCCPVLSVDFKHLIWQNKLFKDVAMYSWKFWDAVLNSAPDSECTWAEHVHLLLCSCVIRCVQLTVCSLVKFFLNCIVRTLMTKRESL